MTFQILLVEDDPAVARALQEALGREGYQVNWKASGLAGLELARSQPPHLALLDVRLPDISGFDVCRRLREAGLKHPVIILTVQNEEVDRILGLEIGADDYIAKPFSLRELLSRIRAQLRRAYGEYAGNNGDVLYAGDLVIDQTRGLARRGDQPLNLTPIEFRLLAYLARHLGQALTRAQIIAEVWGYAADLDSEKTVNVHIRRLREKIELDPQKPSLLLTVPGVGYRLAGDVSFKNPPITKA
jgi:DNA-binding response OmpR family regulator